MAVIVVTTLASRTPADHGTAAGMNVVGIEANGDEEPEDSEGDQSESQKEEAPFERGRTPSSALHTAHFPPSTPFLESNRGI